MYPYSMLELEANVRVRDRLEEAERGRLAAAAKRHGRRESHQPAERFTYRLLSRIRRLRSLAPPRVPVSWLGAASATDSTGGSA